MKILYVCHRFPFPPKRGGKIRPFNMIRHLSAQGHQVTVCSLARSQAEAAEGEGIAGHCHRYEMGRVKNPIQVARMVVRLPLITPSSMGFFYSPELKDKVDALVARERFDLIFVHCSSVAQYVEDVPGTPKILDFGDMDSQKWLEYANYKPFPLSLGYRLEGAKMEAAEKRLARKFDLCTATTRAEWETLESYGAARATDWFPNGVDAGFFKPDGEGYDADTLSFIGRMDYYPNQECMFDFCRNTLPLIQSKRPGAKLLIVGADPSPAVQKLGELPGVTVTGSVPDVRPFILRSAAMVAPLNIARGTQNKIQSMENLFAQSDLSTKFEALGLKHEVLTGVDFAWEKKIVRGARTAAQGGASILTVPAAFNDTTGAAHWESLLRARAIENQCYVLASAQGGVHPSGRRTYGDSLIIDPWGEVLARRAEGPGVVVADLDPARIAEVRTSLPALQHRIL